jgi:diketogulonate reductase-like aldo/keto reductase
MEIATKKLASGFELPVYGLGLWGMGGTREVDTSEDEREVAAIRVAIELGITHIDTAEMYGVGHAEELLARAVEGYDRSKLTIATKALGSNLSYDSVKRALAGSLERMRLDYVDLYLLHWFPEPGVDIVDTMKAMDELVDEGLVRNIGVSNFTPARYTAAQSASKHKLVCNQVYYNVQARAAEAMGVLEQCQRDDVMLVAWRPLEKGALDKTVVVTELAEKYHKTAAQIVLNWLISQDHVVTISKTSTAAHLQENLGALGWEMEPGDIERIRAEYPGQRRELVGSRLDAPGDIAP